MDPLAADRRGLGEGADGRPRRTSRRTATCPCGPASCPCTSPPSRASTTGARARRPRRSRRRWTASRSCTARRVRFRDLRRHGPREQRRLLDVSRAGAAGVVRRDDEHAARDVILARTEIDFRSPVAARRGRRDRRAAGAARHEELRARVRAARERAGSSPKRRASSSATTTSGTRAPAIPDRWRRRLSSEHVRAAHPRQRTARPDGEPAARRSR